MRQSHIPSGHNKLTNLILVVVRVEIEVLCFHVPLVVPPPVECQRLVDEERVVHGCDEQLLCGGQALTLWRPYVQRDPRLGQQPEQPHPCVL